MHCIKYRGNIQSSLILRKEPLIVRYTFDFITVWGWIYSMYVREYSLKFAADERGFQSPVPWFEGWLHH